MSQRTARQHGAEAQQSLSSGSQKKTIASTYVRQSRVEQPKTTRLKTGSVASIGQQQTPSIQQTLKESHLQRVTQKYGRSPMNVIPAVRNSTDSTTKTRKATMLNHVKPPIALKPNGYAASYAQRSDLSIHSPSSHTEGGDNSYSNLSLTAKCRSTQKPSSVKVAQIPKTSTKATEKYSMFIGKRSSQVAASVDLGIKKVSINMNVKKQPAPEKLMQRTSSSQSIGKYSGDQSQKTHTSRGVVRKPMNYQSPTQNTVRRKVKNNAFSDIKSNDSLSMVVSEKSVHKMQEGLKSQRVYAYDAPAALARSTLKTDAQSKYFVDLNDSGVVIQPAAMARQRRTKVDRALNVSGSFSRPTTIIDAHIAPLFSENDISQYGGAQYKQTSKKDLDSLLQQRQETPPSSDSSTHMMQEDSLIEIKSPPPLNSHPKHAYIGTPMTPVKNQNFFPRQDRMSSPKNMRQAPKASKAIPMTAKKSKISNVMPYQNARETSGKFCQSAAKPAKDVAIVPAEKPEHAPTVLTIQRVIAFLLAEEDLVGGYAEMAQQGLFVDIGQQMPHKCALLYADMIDTASSGHSSAKMGRPKVFATQLQVALLIASSLIQVFSHLCSPSSKLMGTNGKEQENALRGLMQQFAPKLCEVLELCHQNLLMLSELILDSRNCNPSQSVDYRLLRKVAAKKLHPKYKQNLSRRLTSIRQNNELVRVSLRKMANYFNSETEDFPKSLIDFGQSILESIRVCGDELSGISQQRNSTSEGTVLRNNPHSKAMALARQLQEQVADLTNSQGYQKNSSYLFERAKTPQQYQIRQPSKHSHNNSKYNCEYEDLPTSPQQKYQIPMPKTSVEFHPATKPPMSRNRGDLRRTSSNKKMGLSVRAKLNYKKHSMSVEDSLNSSIGGYPRSPTKRIFNQVKTAPKIAENQHQQSMLPQTTLLLPESVAFLVANSAPRGAANIDHKSEQKSAPSTNINFYGPVSITSNTAAATHPEMIAKPSVTTTPKFEPQNFKFAGYSNIGSGIRNLKLPTKGQKSSQIIESVLKSPQKKMRDSAIDAQANKLPPTFSPVKRYSAPPPKSPPKTRAKKSVNVNVTKPSKALHTNLSKLSESMQILNKQYIRKASKAQLDSPPKALSDRLSEKDQEEQENFYNAGQPFMTEINHDNFDVESGSIHSEEETEEHLIVGDVEPADDETLIIQPLYSSNLKREDSQAKFQERIMDINPFKLDNTSSLIKINQNDSTPADKSESSDSFQDLERPIDSRPSLNPEFRPSLLLYDDQSNILKQEIERHQALQEKKKQERRVTLRKQNKSMSGPQDKFYVTNNKFDARSFSEFQVPRDTLETVQTETNSPNKKSEYDNSPEIVNSNPKSGAVSFVIRSDNFHVPDELTLTPRRQSVNSDAKPLDMEAPQQITLENSTPLVTSTFEINSSPELFEKSLEDGDSNSLALSQEEEADQVVIDKELEELRKKVTIPYLPPFSKGVIDAGLTLYTLVLDLDETLIHFEENDEDPDEACFLIRPGAIQFLEKMAQYFEIVIFTAAMPDYADWILDSLCVDSRDIISHRLYRQHTSPKEDYAIKDLRLLGRKLEHTIIVDNLAENFAMTSPDNGIWVESWYDDMEDNCLKLLSPFLQELVEKEIPDVREYLKPKIKEKILYRHLEKGKPIPPISQFKVIQEQ